MLEKYPTRLRNDNSALTDNKNQYRKIDQVQSQVNSSPWEEGEDIAVPAIVFLVLDRAPRISISSVVFVLLCAVKDNFKSEYIAPQISR